MFLNDNSTTTINPELPLIFIVAHGQAAPASDFGLISTRCPEVIYAAPLKAKNIFLPIGPMIRTLGGSSDFYGNFMGHWSAGIFVKFNPKFRTYVEYAFDANGAVHGFDNFL